MSSEQVFKCVFCSDTFSQKEDLQIHFRKHGDPNFNQKKSRKSQEESDVCGTEKPKDTVEVVECDVCTEVFSTISKAITHKHKVHPDHDTKYFCPWCGKLFTMKHLYNKHMQATHSDMEKSEERIFRCDTCAVDFNIPTAIAYHNKFYHRQDELPTLGHSKKLKMILEEVIHIFYCPFCGEEYDNKVNLHKHMTDEHYGENQSPEDVFRCPLCDAIFYYLDAYELHLTYHSIEDLYTERNEMMDGIADFSLETVQPLQEKVESVERINEDPSKAIGIEELLEFTMDDTQDNRKSKKHKKHKKSKKNAITLDEFLNMNKDVFGEGIDFQGIEEVPTQVVAKRLKQKKTSPASKTMSPDIAKLKRQGIVVKKQPTKIGKQITMNKEVLNFAMKQQKNMNTITQSKSNALTSTDDVLSKLLNQGSQIKVVKKSHPESEEHNQQQGEENAANERLSSKMMETKKDEDHESEVTGTNNERNSDTTKDLRDNKHPNIDAIQDKSLVASPNPSSPSIITSHINLETVQTHNENSKGSSKSNNDTDECHDTPEKASNLAHHLNSLRNNSNIALKSSKSTVSGMEKRPNNVENDDAQVNDLDTQDADNNATKFDKSSLNALKHLSHLITVKSVNATVPLCEDNKTDNGIQKLETNKTSQLSQSTSNTAKTSDVVNFPNFKNLGGVTIKSTNQAGSTKILPSVEEKNIANEDHETDEEWDDDARLENKTHIDKIAHMLKSPQISVQTKHSTKTIQKESPKRTPINSDNSQSSANLLKHLKNVTAKPINVNSQTISTPQASPSVIKKSIAKPSTVQNEVNEDGIEIFNIVDSDSDDANFNSIINPTTIKSENDKSLDTFKNIQKKIATQSVNQQLNIINQEADTQTKKANILAFEEDDEDWSDDLDEKNNSVNTPIPKFSSPKPNQKHVAINNVLRNLGKNITVKSRNSSPSQSYQSQDNNTRDSHLETNEAHIEANEGDSDSDSPISRVKITEMENSDDEFTSNPQGKNVKIHHPDDSHSEPEEDGAMDEDFEDMSDIESHIAAATVQKNSTRPNSSSLKNINKDVTIKTSNNKTPANSKSESLLSEEIPPFAKNLSNQISIKQIKKPESNVSSRAEQTTAHSMNQSTVNQKMASSSNQVNSFNKEVKTIKTFQTQTKTVIQEITTTVTKTIKTVNQTTKQEVRNLAQCSSAPMIPQKVQGINQHFAQRNFQGVKVRQSSPNIRPKVRGTAPQIMRPAICSPPQVARPAICAPPARPVHQIVPVRPALNRVSGPRPRMPNVMKTRPQTSGQQKPQIGKPVKVSPGAIYSPAKRPAETGHFSCFKKPKESLIPLPDFSTMNKNDNESTVQFSSQIQMSKTNFSSTTKTVKGNQLIMATQMKSEMSASSQQLNKLRNMSGLSVVKTNQNQAKQTQVEEKTEMTASKRNALEAIQKLQNQGLLVKKPRLDVSEDSDHSQPGSDDMTHEHDSNEEFDE